MAQPSFLSRTVEAVRYTLSGVTPQTWMSPNQPLPPQVQQEAGRQFDYPVAYNLNYQPRADLRVKFWRLKALAQGCGLLRIVMESQKDLVTATQWNIKPREIAPGKRPGAGGDKAITDIEAFFRYPDRRHDWAQWSGALLDQAFVLDALSIYRRRDLAGRPYSFEILDGATIRPLIDGSGRQPIAPDAAYQQILKGIPAIDYSTDQLLYYPKNIRVDNPYGYGPVEQIVDYVETAIERVKSQKAWFTEGNLVDGLFSGPVEWKTDQIRAWQGYWDSLFAGNVAMRRKGFWVPNGTTFQSLKGAPLKDEFDEWLARVICHAFRASPQPFIKQVSRGNQESQQEVAEESGVAVYLDYVKRIMDRILTEDFQRPDLEFEWADDREFDPLVSAQIDNLRLAYASRTINEVRDKNGEDPIEGGDTPLIITAGGAVTLDSVLNPPPPPTPVVMQHPGDPNDPTAKPGKPAPAGKTPPKTDPKNPKPTQKLAKAKPAPIPHDRPRTRKAAARMAKALGPVLTHAGRTIADEAKTRLLAMGKAADDTGDFHKIAIQISQAVSLQPLNPIIAAVVDDLIDVADDSAMLATASVGVETSDELTNQVYDRAVKWAQARAAELVSVDGDKTLIDGTRNAIRDVIAKGLADNIGSAKIAEAIEASQAFSADRATLIAHTEIANANSHGALEGYKAARDVGVDVKKEWLAEADCCDDCSANEADGAIDLDEPFSSGDDAPTAHPKCRCAVSPVVSTDEE